MSKRYKGIKLRKGELRYLNVYNVDSIYDCSIIYLADETGFAIYRQGEMEVAPLCEALSLIERITIEPIRNEAKEVYEDFMFVRRCGCSNWHYTGSEVLNG